MSEEIRMDTLTIGKTKITVKIMELNQADLNFYSENPRVYSALNSDGTVPSQEDIEEHMKKMEHVRDLANDIKQNGGLMEEIIVRDKEFVVLEGNSRLAAYRILCEKDAVAWAKIKCKVLPYDIKEDLIFKLIGHFHIKGKKPWEAYEQASYLYRRTQQTKMHIDMIAEELNINKNDAKNMIAAVELMKEKGVSDTHKYSYYFEYVKDPNIRKYRETTDIDDKVCEQISKGEIKEAKDIRKLGKVAKVNDKLSKRKMKEFISGDTSLYEAYNAVDDTGKLEPAVTKLKSFRTYINGDSFEKNVRSSEEVYKNTKYEIGQIIKRLTQLQKKWEKMDE